MNKVLPQAEQLAMMIKLAATHHMKQFDKGGRPYVLHVLKVMHYLKDKDDDLLNCMAVGHDLLEDTPVQAIDLERLGISTRVIQGITVLTKVPNQSHTEYLRGILLSYDACRVKLADLRHNTDIRRLKGLREKDLQRMAKYHTMHTQIKDMIQWYENNSVLWYPHETAWEKERDQYVEKIIKEFE
ncbi:putative metal dependent phosphohydrolase [Cronobacter phage CR8]|uniref:Putative metal dependent phosphohydrolase n=1 Tax=Cronobacter phage CR8 TaxID=1327934 RepID=A0A060AGB2_9CAUD|nr:putative metal dependent phosphohydrolase [Cronobacter phage CR8]AIA64641.1 putative metal dependent phosphohydrolase [Cronobacter phage CR8]UTC25308.1 putative metal dependent phosphohydrolase [Pectobacterium phage vB_PcaM_P7_Pc]